ncbi:hypothetical protein C8R45DRAFT_314523 [Mycena sanguinolenta]|nr:hypothetical protein C8R45DRAFT_314523 [Mycena sanguinolenta]
MATSMSLSTTTEKICHLSPSFVRDKSKILLHRDMLPSIDWAGVSVKYYMDISVLFGQDELRARVPLRII